VKIYTPNFENLFTTKLSLSVLLRAFIYFTYAKMTQTLRTNFATEQKVDFIRVTRAAITTFSGI